MKFIVCLAILTLGTHSLSAYGETSISLSLKEWHHITFDDIPSTKYTNEQDSSLKADVASSSSFLVMPFSREKQVRGVRFRWKSHGELNVSSAAIEETKSGDDGFLKVGVMLEGSEPWIPFFAPGWIKAIRKSMILPTDRLIYLLVGAKHPVGSTWKSPYSDDMEFRSVASEQMDAEWKKVDYAFSSPKKVVGLWVMSDGDNTKSKFSTWLKDLTLF